jgi:hypothetical protein
MIDLVLSCLSSFFQFCLEEDYIESMVIKKRWRPKLPQALPRYLNEQESARGKLAAEKLIRRCFVMAKQWTDDQVYLVNALSDYRNIIEGKQTIEARKLKLEFEKNCITKLQNFNSEVSEPLNSECLIYIICSQEFFLHKKIKRKKNRCYTIPKREKIL